VTVDLGAGTATGGAGNDSLFSIENVEGSAFGDTLRGDTDNNQLFGLDGDDLLWGEGGGLDLFDGGAGNDVLNIVNSGVFVNDLSVCDVEHVNSVGLDSDHIRILGNSDAPTIVTAGGNSDFIWLSNDADHIRYTSISDSANVIDPEAGLGDDSITDFDAAEDLFIFEGIPTTEEDFSWTFTEIGGAPCVLVDFNGDASGDLNWDMRISVTLTGTTLLSDDNFLVL
jgi:Ca2+-binding RTX toxin-like protein